MTKVSHPRKPHVKLDIVKGLMEWKFDYGTIEEIKTQLDNEVASHSKVKPFFFLAFYLLHMKSLVAKGAKSIFDQI